MREANWLVTKAIRPFTPAEEAALGTVFIERSMRHPNWKIGLAFTNLLRWLVVLEYINALFDFVCFVCHGESKKDRWTRHCAQMVSIDEDSLVCAR